MSLLFALLLDDFSILKSNYELLFLYNSLLYGISFVWVYN